MKDKVVLVTGGSRGIGRAIALECGQRGAHVVVNYRANEIEAQKVVAQINKLGGSAELNQADIGKVEEISLLFNKIAEKKTKLDVLVNNAGIMINTPLAQVSEEEYDEVFDLNAKGLFFCCQKAVEIMPDGGRIINIGTSVTRIMLPNYATYAASKGAVEQLTRVLAKEVGCKGITVNTISPGPTDTELFRIGKSEEQIQALADMSAFGRVGTPIDIGKAVALLISRDASWISGQTIFVNGGFI